MSLYRFSFAMLALLAPLAHGAAICDDKCHERWRPF